MTEKPRLIVHALASVDGRLTLAPDVLLLHGDERWRAVAGSSEDVYERLKQAYQPDAILEGSGSFVVEGAEADALPSFKGDPEALYAHFLPEAVVQRPQARGWFVVVDGRGRVRGWIKQWPGEAWEGWHLLVLVARQTPAEYLAYLQGESIPYLVVGDSRVDLALAVEKLKTELGVACVVSTAGGRLNGALLRAGLVDEIQVEFFPAVIGGADTPSLFDSPALEPQELPTALRLISAQVQRDGRVRLRYEVETAVGRSSESEGSLQS